MQSFLRWLRSLGSVGAFFAMVLTYLTISWGVALSVAAGIVASLWATALHFFQNPNVQIGIGVFLATLWTCIGVLALVDRKKPSATVPFQDLRYGLVFEGVSPVFVHTNSFFPDVGSLQFVLQIRNTTTGPIQYSLESLDARIGTRAMPKYKANTVSGYMARISARHVRGDSFPGGTLNEFYGKGRITGTLDFSVTYGAPDAPPARRLKFSLETYLIFPENGMYDKDSGAQFSYADKILSEQDEAI